MVKLPEITHFPSVIGLLNNRCADDFAVINDHDLIADMRGGSLAQRLFAGIGEGQGYDIFGVAQVVILGSRSADGTLSAGQNVGTVSKLESREPGLPSSARTAFASVTPGISMLIRLEPS